MDRKKIKSAGLALLIIMVLVLLSALDIYKCPLRFFLGLPCPLCGMTRAYMALLRLDFSEAFYYHLMWPFVILVALLWLLKTLKLIKINERIFMGFLIFLAVINLFYYFYRLLGGSSVIYFDFNNSLLNRIICK